MGFKRMKGVTGLVYVPGKDDEAKKHPCPDCHFCQWCSDDRCGLCLESRVRSPAGTVTSHGRKRRRSSNR
ncbi:MAG: hypothetical protein HY901_36835 [Deltaproteobacteria bacterium]|nr:hypothetical protein [Deltaproteobacteria bacterium]